MKINKEFFDQWMTGADGFPSGDILDAITPIIEDYAQKMDGVFDGNVQNLLKEYIVNTNVRVFDDGSLNIVCHNSDETIFSISLNEIIKQYVSFTKTDCHYNNQVTLLKSLEKAFDAYEDAKNQGMN